MIRWIFLIIISGFLTLENTAEAARTYLTRDFFIEVVQNNLSNNSLWSEKIEEKPTNCRENIKNIVCLVDPHQTGRGDNAGAGGDGGARVCLKGSEAYAAYFEALYDAYPPVLQKMFCSLKIINIEKKFSGTAYAGLVKNNDGKIIGAEMGIRQSVLDENLTLSTWASWKDQLSFGGVKDSYTITPGLPFVETTSELVGTSDFLYFVVAHEFGHMLDFTNNLNQTLNCDEEDLEKQDRPECLMNENSWGGLSWISDRRAKPENEFIHRKDLCFYSCNDKVIDPSLAVGVYSEMYSTSFISFYAATQPWDDLADSLAYFVMNQNLSTKYIIQTNSGRHFDIMEKLRSSLWVKKYQYLENLLKRNDLIYP